MELLLRDISHAVLGTSAGSIRPCVPGWDKLKGKAEVDVLMLLHTFPGQKETSKAVMVYLDFLIFSLSTAFNFVRFVFCSFV
jgi:hypothetical protein